MVYKLYYQYFNIKKQFMIVLDIFLNTGAGDGNVTLKMAPYFKDVFVTEISPVMRWRLSKHGFT